MMVIQRKPVYYLHPGSPLIKLSVVLLSLPIFMHFSYLFLSIDLFLTEGREEKEKPKEQDLPTLPPGEDPKILLSPARRLEKKFTSMSVISNLSSYLNDSQKETLQKYISQWQGFTAACRAFAKILMHALLRNSYLASLVGLYICGLTRVNLLNAGYCMFTYLFFIHYILCYCNVLTTISVLFFIAFIISPWLARKLWVTLVIYAQAVVALLFVWQISWNYESQNSEFLKETVGLQYYSNLWRSTILNLVIVAFSVIQWNVNAVCLPLFT